MGGASGGGAGRGGFEWNAQMVQAFIGHAVEPLSPPGNEGDGHVMAMEAEPSWPTCGLTGDSRPCSTRP